MSSISRRALLTAAALSACGRRRGSGFPGHVFVANQEGRSVAAVDLTAFAVAARIPLGAAPGAVVAHPRRRSAYVLAPEEGVIFEIDAARLELRRRLRLGGPAISMRLAPDGQALWVLCREPRCLARVMVEDLRVARRIRLPGAGEDFDISRDGQLAVAFPKDGRVGFAGPAATAIESLAAAGPDPWVVRFQFNPTQLIVGNRAARSITLVDVRGARAVVHLPIPVEPASFCFNVDGGQLFVAGPGLDAVVIVDPYHTQISETILAGKLPGAMACSETPQYLFVSNPSSATVTVLDIETRKLVAVVGVGQDPGQILITPDGQYAMVLNRQSGDLAVFRVGALRFDPEGNTRRYTAPPLFSLIPVGPRPVSAAILMG